MAGAIFTMLEDAYVELEAVESQGERDVQEASKPDRSLAEQGQAEEE
mgnify:CR=1 FL=1